MRMISIAGPACVPLTSPMPTQMRLKDMPAEAVGRPVSGPMPAGIGTRVLTPIRLSRAMGFSTVHLAGATILPGTRSARPASGILAATAITLGRAIVLHMALRLVSPDTLRILAETASLPVASEVSTVLEVSAAVAEDSMVAAEVSMGAAAMAAVVASTVAVEEDTAVAVDIANRQTQRLCSRSLHL